MSENKRHLNAGHERTVPFGRVAGAAAESLCCCFITKSINSHSRDILLAEALYKFKFAQLVNGTCTPAASLSGYSKGWNKKYASAKKQGFDLRSEAECQ